MIIKSLKNVQAFIYYLVIGFSLLLVSQLHAQVSVKNIEKNDKVVSNELSSGEALNNSVSIGQHQNWVLKAEQWELTRSGESLLSLPVLNQLINTWLEDREKKIEIQYPGGEEGEFWVQELADWLVSLGIPSKQMVVVPGSGADDMIKFNLIK